MSDYGVFPEAMRYVILGTSGHIDHGKSALVKALTGIDPDRLKEEKERGITIDLGFADLKYPDGLTVGIVDVPGHERLIRNMLAGAGGIDLVLMVVAADEGIMPQTREHLAICDLLKIKNGLIAVTKSDLVDEEWMGLVMDEIRGFVKGTFLEGADIIPVSSKTGENILLLKERIRLIASRINPKPVNSIFRLFVDRVFTLKGFGTVVTGTAISGSVSLDSQVEVLPQRIMTRVRGLQSHGEAIDRAYAGQRVAINLQGIAKDEVKRGDVIATPDKLSSSHVIDAFVEVLRDTSLPSIKSGSLVHFYTGSAEVVGRMVLYEKDELLPGEGSLCRFRFMKPIVTMSGDRFIIRRPSPLLTLGGGEILDPSPPRKKKGERIVVLNRLINADIEERLMARVSNSGLNGVSRSEIEGWINAEFEEIDRGIDSLLNKEMIIQCGKRYVSKEIFDDFSLRILSILKVFHKENPLKAGMQKDSIRAYFKGLDPRQFELLLQRIDGLFLDRETVMLSDFKVSVTDDRKEIMDKMMKEIENGGFQPPTREELANIFSMKEDEVAGLLRIMASDGRLVRINDFIYITSAHYQEMLSGVKDFFKNRSEMAVSEFRDIFKTTRKYALPFLEHLDSQKVTLRVGDVRRLFTPKGS